MQVVVSLPVPDMASDSQATETLLLTAPSSMTAQQLLQAREAVSPCQCADLHNYVCSILSYARNWLTVCLANTAFAVELSMMSPTDYLLP